MFSPTILGGTDAIEFLAVEELDFLLGSGPTMIESNPVLHLAVCFGGAVFTTDRKLRRMDTVDGVLGDGDAFHKVVQQGGIEPPTYSL